MYNELYHHGIMGMRWGVRRYQNPDGSLTPAGKKRYDDRPFTASNGLKVGKPKNAYVRTLGRIASNRGFESYNEASYRHLMGTRHANTVSNRIATEKGVQRMRKEAAAIREYNAHQKDFRKGTGDKYLNKAIRRNKIDQAYEKIQSDSTMADRLLYNNATRRKAAKYVVDNNMTIAEARKKANKVAWRNTAIFTAAYGAVTLAELYAMKR